MGMNNASDEKPNTYVFEFRDSRDNGLIDTACFSNTLAAVNYARELAARDEERPIAVLIRERGTRPMMITEVRSWK